MTNNAYISPLNSSGMLVGARSSTVMFVVLAPALEIPGTFQMHEMNPSERDNRLVGIGHMRSASFMCRFT